MPTITTIVGTRTTTARDTTMTDRIMPMRPAITRAGTIIAITIGTITAIGNSNAARIERCLEDFAAMSELLRLRTKQ